MAHEKQPPEHRRVDGEHHGSNISWQISGPIVGSPSSLPTESTTEASPADVVGDWDDFEDTVDVTITAAELRNSGIPEGQYVALAPGQDLKLTSRLDVHESHRQAVFVGRGELVVQDHVHGFHTRHFQLPTGHLVEGGDPSVITKVAVANIRRKAIGWKSLGTHLTLFLDGGDQVMTRLDSSVEYGYNSTGTWEFHLDALAALCAAGGIAFESESYDSAQQFLAERPEWAPPKLEFEVDHILEEDVREWGLAIALALPISFALLAVVGGALLLFGPVGWVVGSLEIVGTLVAIALTIWSHSRWRMKRSLLRRTQVQR